VRVWPTFLGLRVVDVATPVALRNIDGSLLKIDVLDHQPKDL
jgi:hypothetical protein